MLTKAAMRLVASSKTITKHSLKDWCVTDAKGNTVAWITKVKLGYEVSLKLFDFKDPYFFSSFAEAKRCALED